MAEVPFLAVDLETTGRDARSAEIVSVGWVEVRHSTIDLSTAARRMVRTSRSMPEQSAVIHSITDDEAASGEPLDAVLAELLRALAGRVLLAHYLPAESGFLDAACRRCFGAGSGRRQWTRCCSRGPGLRDAERSRERRIAARRVACPPWAPAAFEPRRTERCPRHGGTVPGADGGAGAAGPVKLKALLAHRS